MNLKFRRAHLALLTLVVFLGIIILLADSGHGVPLFRLAAMVPFGDKLSHLLLFGALSFLVNLTWRGAGLRVFAWRMLAGSALILPIVTLEECSQIFFRSRTFDLADLAADCAGIWLFGRAAVSYLNWRLNQKTASD